MASLADQYTYSQTSTFQNRVRVALTATAIAVAGEAQAYNRNRVSLAVAVLESITSWLNQFAVAAANDATVSGKIAVGGATGTDTDTDVNNAISAAWNAMAQR